MAGLLPGDSGLYDKQPDEANRGCGRWYYSRKEIEENSPSRRDGIDLKKETYLRKSYCTFLQDLGMRLKVPQVTIATAIIFCHRFFLRQSHAKNDRRTIATVCMFLAGKVEETPRPLKDVILVSYEIINKKDPSAVQRIKQKEVYEQQKELILLGERVVLATLGFDLNVNHPYKPLVEAIKKFKVAQNALAQVAWNFVNDGLRTSLCLQFKPHHIAAGAIFLAAKFLKVKLPSDGEKVWWQEFDVTPRQLEEVSNQMLELYEQNRLPPPSQTSEVEGSAGGGVTPRAPTKEEHLSNNSNSQGGVATSKLGTLKSALTRPASDQLYHANHAGPSRPSQNHSHEMNSKSDHKRDGEVKVEVQSNSEDQEMNTGRSEKRESGDLRDKHHGQNLDYKDIKISQSPQGAIIKIDKIKAALEKQRKARGARTRKAELDEDDLIERELEDGIELPAETEKEKIKRERKQNWPKPSNRPDHDYGHLVTHEDEDGEEDKKVKEEGEEFDHVEDGEVATFDDADRGYRSPTSGNRKRKAGGSPHDKPLEGKRGHDFIPPVYNHHDFPERDHKRQAQENHV